MARKAWCPDCQLVVELPHRPGDECPFPPYKPENEGGPEPVKYTGPRDDEGRPIGRGFRPGDGAGQSRLIEPKLRDVTNT